MKNIMKFEEQPRNELSVIKDIHGRYNFSVQPLVGETYFDDDRPASVILSKEQIKKMIKNLNKLLEE